MPRRTTLQPRAVLGEPELAGSPPADATLAAFTLAAVRRRFMLRTLAEIAAALPYGEVSNRSVSRRSFSRSGAIAQRGA